MAATVVVAGVAVAALAVALGAPLWSTALALMAFGLLHNALELRYVGGRFPRLLSGPYLLALVGIITAIVVARLAASLGGSGWTMRSEIVLAYALLVTAVVVGARGRRSSTSRPTARSGPLGSSRSSGSRRSTSRRSSGSSRSMVSPVAMAALVVLAVAAAASWRWTDHHVVVITHLHNLIPLAFLWELSRSMAPAARRAFRGAQLAWVVVVPALILAGTFDAVIGRGAGDVPGLGGVGQIAPFTSLPGAWDTVVGRRFLAVFAFLQLMHFVVWVFVIPRWTPRATATFEARVPALRGRRFWALTVCAAVAFVVLFVADYAEGRSAYTALASYHAYLELPLLVGVAFLAGRGTSSRAPGSPGSPAGRVSDGATAPLAGAVPTGPSISSRGR